MELTRVMITATIIFTVRTVTETALTMRIIWMTKINHDKKDDYDDDDKKNDDDDHDDDDNDDDDACLHCQLLLK